MGPGGLDLREGAGPSGPGRAHTGPLGSCALAFTPSSALRRLPARAVTSVWASAVAESASRGFGEGAEAEGQRLGTVREGAASPLASLPETQICLLKLFFNGCLCGRRQVRGGRGTATLGDRPPCGICAHVGSAEARRRRARRRLRAKASGCPRASRSAHAVWRGLYPIRPGSGLVAPAAHTAVTGAKLPVTGGGRRRPGAGSVPSYRVVWAERPLCGMRVSEGLHS